MELEKVKNLTHDDIVREKVAIGVTYISTILADSISATAVFTGAVPVGLLVSPPDPQSIRSNVRFNGEKKNKNKR